MERAFSFNFELQQFLDSIEALLWSSKPKPLARLVPLTFTARTAATSAKCSSWLVAGGFVPLRAGGGCDMGDGAHSGTGSWCGRSMSPGVGGDSSLAGSRGRKRPPYQRWLACQRGGPASVNVTVY